VTNLRGTFVPVPISSHTTEATSLDWKSQCLEDHSVPHYSLLIRNREYIEFETLKK
jgi:hypothetical protein